MNEELKPCRCGYRGALMGMQNQGYLSLSCPECRRTVEAFTAEGLAVAWNKTGSQTEDD